MQGNKALKKLIEILITIYTRITPTQYMSFNNIFLCQLRALDALKTMVIYLCTCCQSGQILCNCWHRDLSGHVLSFVLHVLGRLVDAAHDVVYLF